MGSPAIKYDKYTYSDYVTWDDTYRWELINGYPYNMSPAPNRLHQQNVTRLSGIFSAFLSAKTCEVYVAPFDVRLAESEETFEFSSNVVQPDISVICDKKKLDEHGAIGAPDLVVEVLSPSTLKKDTQEKFLLYERFGVKEYWIIDPDQKSIAVYLHSKNKKFVLSNKYHLNDHLSVTTLPGLKLQMEKLFSE